MKKRTFYVINLDRGRILALSLVFSTVILATFALGIRSGKVRSIEDQHVALKNPVQDPIKTQENRGRSPYEHTRSKTDPYSLTKKPARTEGIRKSEPSNGSHFDNARNSRRNEFSIPSFAGRELSQERKFRAQKKNHKRKNYKKKNYQKRTQQKSTLQKRKYKARISHNRKARKLKQRRHRKQRTYRKTRKKLSKRRYSSRKNRKRLHKNDSRAPLLKRSASGKKTSFGNPGETAKTRRVVKKAARKNKAYFLQLGAFRYKNGANRMATSLKRNGFTPRIKRQKGRYTVILGNSRNSSGLRRLKGRLKKKRYAPIMIRDGR